MKLLTHGLLTLTQFVKTLLSLMLFQKEIVFRTGPVRTMQSLTLSLTSSLIMDYSMVQVEHP
jgi:hypothetical protein